MLSKIFISIKSFFIKIILLKNVRISFSTRLKIYKNVKTELSNYNYIVLKNGNVDRDKLYEILERERFIF